VEALQTHGAAGECCVPGLVVSMAVGICSWGVLMGAGTRGILGGDRIESRGSGLFYLRGGRLVKWSAAGVERVMEEVS
jgi:hypothetical protein